ncbi:MAG: cytochrome c [Gammaproteobacteria bacterium]|nr:cytochrome c [Gammaproteobacteria bacterium]
MRLILTVLFSIALGMTAATVSAAGDADKGKEKSAVCASCHGVDGNSTIPANPRLAGQHASYLLQALHDYKSGARKNPIMAGFAGTLSEEDMQDLAAYFASQSGLATPD